MNKQTIQNSPLVTVAMVTYNSAKYLGMAIDSVLSSSYTNFELIISDDCSTDNTWDIIREYKDQRIRASRNETNLREYPNRNKCIDLAKGEFIIFIDGDDYIYPHGLEHFVKLMLNNPECAMGLSRPYDARYIYPIKLSPQESIKNHFLSTSTLNLALVRNIFITEVLKKEIKFPTKFIAGDHYLRLQLATKYPCLLIYDGLVHWRLHENQASQQFNTQIHGILENWKIENDILNHKDVPLSKKELRLSKKRKYIRLRTEIIKQLMKVNFVNAFKLFRLTFKETK